MIKSSSTKTKLKRTTDLATGHSIFSDIFNHTAGCGFCVCVGGIFGVFLLDRDGGLDSAVFDSATTAENNHNG